MSHLVLLGDSTFDNSAYVGRGPAVIDHVRRILSEGDRATLLAVDGNRIEGVHRQLGRLPADATHLALSVGGNDLIAEAALLGRSAATVGQGMLMLAEVCDRFETDYSGLLKVVLATRLPTVLCTVYAPPFPDPIQRRAVATTLGLFDDTIVRLARSLGVPVLEMRAVCSEDSDFANPIEPSVAGGEKIARSLCEIVARHDFAANRTVVYP